MKKIVHILLWLLCVAQFAAASPIHVSPSMTYSSTYKGAGRNGHIHTTSSARVVSIGASGMAQMPAVSMSSTSSIRQSAGNNGVASTAIPQVQGIRTCASNISGGMTSSETYAHMGHSHKTPPIPGICEHCQWVQDENGDWYCSVCGSYAEDGCIHMDEEGYCWCPIEDGWQVWLFMAALAAAYTLYKKRDSHPTGTSVMRT